LPVKKVEQRLWFQTTHLLSTVPRNKQASSAKEPVRDWETVDDAVVPARS
jgi:hypothetical protein